MATLLDLYPAGIFSNPDVGFPCLVENVLIRSFFDPRVKEFLSWIGVSQRRGGPKAFTAKIRTRPGVYGLFYLGSDTASPALKQGFFDIKYFPSVEEPLFETFSFAESMLRLHEDFDSWVRIAPPQFDPLISAFTVGRLCMAVDAQDSNVLISLWAPNRWRHYQKDGLTAHKDDGFEVLCVEPGGLDRNVPAFGLSWSFFHSLVGSFAVQLGKSPDIVVFKRRHGWITEISADGGNLVSESTEVRDKLLTSSFISDDKGGSIEEWRQRTLEFRPDHWPDSPDDESEVILCSESPAHGSSSFPFLWSPDPKEISGNRKSGKSKDFRPPFIVITGFLGSGKTTLLNQVVEWKALGQHRFVAVIQNELGPEAVDSGLTEGAYKLVEITEGCVCCGLAGDLVRAVQGVCTNYKPDLVILETTGMVDPKNLLEEMPHLKPYVRFDSLITLVDASTFFQALHEYSVVRAQILAADLIILNKIDLISERDLEAIRSTVAEIAPRAAIVNAVRASVPLDLLFSADSRDLDRSDQGPVSVPSHDGGFDTHLHLHTDNVGTFSLRTSGLFDRSKILRFLDDLPRSVYRLKGVLIFAGEEKPKLLQYVGGRYEFQSVPQSDISPNIMVFIGREMDVERLRERVFSCLTEPETLQV